MNLVQKTAFDERSSRQYMNLMPFNYWIHARGLNITQIFCLILALITCLLRKLKK